MRHDTCGVSETVSLEALFKYLSVDVYLDVPFAPVRQLITRVGAGARDWPLDVRRTISG